MEAKGEQAEGLLEEVQLPADPEGQAQLGWEQGCKLQSARPCPRAGPLLPAQPRTGPAHSSQVWAEGARLHTGPGQGCRLARPQPQSGHLGGLFFSPSHVPVNKQSPFRVYQNKRPNRSAVPRPGQNCLSRPNSKPGLPDSHDPVILGGPGMGSILGPKGSDITRSPSPGLQAHLGPQKPSKGRPLAYRPATGHPIPFWANELSCPRGLSRLRSLDFASSALQSHCPG